MNDTLKRSISLAVLALGMVAGLYGCAVAPKAIFVIGVNDSAPSIWAGLLSITTLLLVCVMGLWKSAIPDIWLIFFSLFWIYAAFAQNHYMKTVRHFSGSTYREILTIELIPTYLFMGIGLFCLLTHRAGWPSALGSPLPDRVESSKTP